MDKKIDAQVVQLLKNKKKLDDSSIKNCFLEAAKKQVSPIPIICALHKLDEKEILEIIASEFNNAYLDLKGVSIEKTLVEKVPVKIASYYKFLPISLENRNLTIAVPYPLDVKIKDEIRSHLGFGIKTVLSCEHDVMEILKQYYGLGAAMVEKIISQKTYENVEAKIKADEHVDDLEEEAVDTVSVIQLVNQIILEAFRKRATDIHIEPYRSKLRLRYRIDGILYDANVTPEIRNFLVPILSRIKLMSNLNIVERRVPQDGRAIVKAGDQKLDLRVSFMPTPHGESVVIRILPAIMLFDLEKLGLDEYELAFFKDLISKPHGIIFVTGPTGSGKTTTLYACLSTINTNERKIITIEDPIEYELEGITQIQIASEVGLDFARGLRSMLRHDPDVMMVGEVRDLETAEIAIRVALTGHLVFSTLHTNDAASGITRLVDIGLEPYLVASSVDAFIAQRLIRVNCPHCKQEDNDPISGMKEQIAKELGYDDKNMIKIYRSIGCQACNFTGFYGRTAIHEILVMNEAIKELTAQKASSDRIKKCAVVNGMRTLRQNGWLKVIAGITTPSEIIRVTQSDELMPGLLSTEMQSENERFETEPEILKESTSVAGVTQERTQKEKSSQPSDRRIYGRKDDRIYIRFKIFKAGKAAPGVDFEPEMVGVTKNISAGGLLFNISEYFTPGKIIEMKLELPDDERNIECLAKIIRCQEVLANKDYEIAVCFLDLPNSERRRLSRYINK
ncbi:MAG: ATPase, T2SS/T4P/T4SS family [Candidatus Omnitrophota bacterium]